ncbi:TIGR04222 domain-containing membrane protein [Streptomyces sp. NPDC020898]|uniref:TIGR04222 domain-containing membrane protein n=1 Tax=Streptomyces sp. NPDC020898 TaxID=3365101 RepID=UPI003796763E
MGVAFRRPVSAIEGPEALDVYEVAFLAGGAQRVVDSAVIALVERGLLKLSGSRVRAVGEVLPEHPVECALFASCPHHRSAASVLAALRRSSEVQKIARRLAARNLVSGSRRRLTRSGRRQLRAAERGEGLPDYVFGGPAVLPDGLVRRGVVSARPLPSGLGRALIRMGKALDNSADTGSDSGSGCDSDAGSGFASSCGGGSNSG